MTTTASQMTSPTAVYSTFYSDADQRKHQRSASLAFEWGIHRDRWIPHTKASYAENVSIWWRHHVPAVYTCHMGLELARHRTRRCPSTGHQQSQCWVTSSMTSGPFSSVNFLKVSYTGISMHFKVVGSSISKWSLYNLRQSAVPIITQWEKFGCDIQKQWPCDFLSISREVILPGHLSCRTGIQETGPQRMECHLRELSSSLSW